MSKQRLASASLRFPRHARIPLAFLASLAAPALAQNVIVVAPTPGPGVDSTDIASAVAQAPSGSTLLLRAGTYGGFFVPASKSLHLTADHGAQVTLTVPSIVFQLEADDVFSLRGIDFAATTTTPLTVSGCQGAVWIEDCEIHATAGPLSGAMTVIDSPSVTLVRTKLFAAEHGRALFARAAANSQTNVHAFGCEFHGGVGSLTQSTVLDGGDAVRLEGAQFFASDSLIRGGDGISNQLLGVGCLQSAGGDGIAFVAGAHPNGAALLASQLQGGAGATACGGPAVDGVPFSGPGTVTALAGSPRGLGVNSPVREGGNASLQFAGASGEFALLAIGQPSVGSGAGTWSNLLAPVLVGAPLTVFAVGAVPPSGTLATSIPIQELGAGVEGFALHAQPAFVSIAAASVQLGAPTQIVLLDQAL